jgi:hypothetical protein
VAEDFILHCAKQSKTDLKSYDIPDNLPDLKQITKSNNLRKLLRLWNIVIAICAF